MNEVGELGGIPQEEDWCIVCNHVPVSFFGSELDGEASRVTSAVVRTRLATDGRESDSDRALLAFLGEEISLRQFWDGVCALKEAVSTTALGVDNTFWDSFSVEMREEIDEMKVLKKKRTVLAYALCLVWVRHGYTIAGGVYVVFASGLAISLV